MGVQGAVRSCDGGILLDVDVTPSAKSDVFPDGYNEWRERIDVRVQAPAEGGEANRALCELVAARLGIEAAEVGIQQGHTSTRKRVLARGLTPEQALERLQEGQP
jgi:uncharacterized protein (TIGR00251 family)